MKSHMFLLLPTLCIKMPDFQLHLNILQPTFLYILKFLSTFKVNSVLVWNLTLCHKIKPHLTAFKKVLDIHLYLYK